MDDPNMTMEEYIKLEEEKAYLLTEPTLNPHHINEFNLNNETSRSEYDEEEQNILYSNDLFPSNIIRPDDLKSEKDNDDNDIDIMQSFKVKIVIWKYFINRMLFYLIMNLCAPFGIPFDPKWYYKDGDCAITLRRPRYMALLPREQRHHFLRYEGLEYSDADIADFEARLARIYKREVHRVHVFDFRGFPDLMAKGLSARMLMEHRDDQGIPDKRDLRDYWIGISSTGDFLGTVPSYTMIRDPILRLCHRLIACSIAGRSQAPEKVTVTDLFYLRGMDIDSVNVPYLLARYLRGLMFISPKLPIIDMAELRQSNAVASAPAIAEDAPAVDKGDQAVLAPVQAP
ncbi:hypothetical protein Tco_0875368 [Tanacetum coccineum]|uniref:Uncharacterized protein n=1 Tax=Tanacetum coccineum TaxID=301880 RepID=A0ABQ5BS68_9ASTR